MFPYRFIRKDSVSLGVQNARTRSERPERVLERPRDEVDMRSGTSQRARTIYKYIGECIDSHSPSRVLPSFGRTKEKKKVVERVAGLL